MSPGVEIVIHPTLPKNEQVSLRPLISLNKRLQQQGLPEDCEQIIREQLKKGIIEPAPQEPNDNEFYIPHKPVVRETAESTKMRIVYNASAKASPTVYRL